MKQYLKQACVVFDTQFLLNSTRILFGIYLLYFGIKEFNYLGDIYSNDGFIVYSEMTILPKAIYSILSEFRSVKLVYLFGFLNVLASLTLILNIFPKSSLIVLFIAKSYFHLISDYFMTPDTHMILYLVLFLFFMTSKYKGNRKKYVFEIRYYVIYWISIALVYFYAGLDKIISSEWRQGLAIEKILNYGITTTYLYNYIESFIPKWSLVLFCYTTIFFELFFLFGIINGQTRRVMLFISIFTWSCAMFVLNVHQFLILAIICKLPFLDEKWISKEATNFFETFKSEKIN